MNEKIRDLQIQAFAECKTFEGDKIRTDEVFERFAELLIRECANICFSEAEGHSMAFGEHCGIIIKEHFGVEE